MKYRKRVCDEILEDKLNLMGAVLIEGTKWCGKTTSAEQKAKTTVMMNDPEKNYLSLAEIKPSELLKGKTPLLIDEWQRAPQLWDAVRFEVDKRGEPGQFILTGSATPIDKTKISHSGIGRISRMTMRPMSLYESGDSSGEVPLSYLFESDVDLFVKADTDIDRIAYLVCRGGWPQVLDKNEANALKISYEYVEGLIDADLEKSIGRKINKTRASKLLKSYSRNIGTQINVEEIRRDIIGKGENTQFGINTLHKYIDALKDSYIIEDAESWSAQLRSRTIIRSTPTRYFVDPSIAAAALRVGPNDLINDLRTFGFLFENMVMRDLRVYAESIDGDVYHYLDKDNLECDAIIHLRNGKYGLVEIKLGGETNIEKGANSLNKLEAKIDFESMAAPSFKMVIVGVGSYAYKRKDGVIVMPVTSLKN